LPIDECAYIHYPDPKDPHDALSPLQAIAGAVSVDESILDSQNATFRRGIHPSHALILGKQPSADVPGGLRPHLTAAQERQIIGAVLKRYQGTSKHGEPLILDGLIEDIKQLSHSPSEMDWLNSGKASKERISQGFGVSPIIMGEIEGANRASAAVADQHFVNFTINPIIELMSQCLTEFLSPMFGGGIKVWIEPCIAKDADMALSWAMLLSNQGVLTAHELRQLSPFGLPHEKQFDNQLVGGQNMATTNPIAAGIASMVDGHLATVGAQNIIGEMGRSRNGNAGKRTNSHNRF
jgi:phage portal protein BeeE